MINIYYIIMKVFIKIDLLTIHNFFKFSNVFLLFASYCINIYFVVLHSIHLKVPWFDLCDATVCCRQFF
jgi:hypothetical protein